MAFGVDRRAYLAALRERALARVREEESAVRGEVKVVSRREGLRWMGLAAMAAVLPLRAKAAGILAARAEGVGSARSGAPQYGAPSWYAPQEPYARVAPQSQVTRSRTELGDAKTWIDVNVYLVSEKSSRDSRDSRKETRAKEGFYEDNWGGGTHALLAIGDPDANCAYIVRGWEDFYLAVGDEMYACRVGPGVFLMNGSLFRREGSGKEGLAGVISDFTQVSDLEAYRRDREGTVISLEKGLPQEFWVRNGEMGWVQNGIRVMQTKRRADVLELTLRSDNYPSAATFSIDLAAKKLLKTKFEGKEWAS